jgi:hypothetical protein
MFSLHAVDIFSSITSNIRCSPKQKEKRYGKILVNHIDNIIGIQIAIENGKNRKKINKIIKN